ncbi:MAG: hypothetical protein ABH851_04460 [Methanobacteriota archaeon]
MTVVTKKAGQAPMVISEAARARHEKVELTLPTGKVVDVDVSIAELLEDLIKPSFVKSSRECCAGAKWGDADEIKDPVLGKAYWPRSYLDVIYNTDPESLDQATAFDKELRALRVKTGDVTGRVAVLVGEEKDTRELIRRRGGEQDYNLIFDQEPTLEAVEKLWRAFHSVVKKHLPKE